MSYEAWGDGDGDDGMDGYFTAERCEDFFTAGAQAMREMLARFVEPQSKEIAASIRANWIPSWGDDPGPLTSDIPTDCWTADYERPSVQNAQQQA